MRSKMFIAGLLVGGLSAAPSVTAAAEPGDVTFTKDVAPILQRSCENCHRQSGAAPMPLVTYEEVRPWARSIKNRTGAREMPPWFIDKNIGIQRFKDDPSLSDEEIAAIAAWVDNGAPRGNPADLPPPVQWPTDGWTYGTPDLIVPSPEGTVAANAADWFGEWGETPTGLTEDRYIKAIEVKEVRLHEKAPADLVWGRTDGRTWGCSWCTTRSSRRTWPRTSRSRSIAATRRHVWRTTTTSGSPMSWARIRRSSLTRSG